MARNDTKRTVGRPGWLEKNKTFNAPVRRTKKFKQIAELVGSQARTWEGKRGARLYFADDSYLWTDETGLVRTNGGATFRFKVEHNLT